MSSGEISGVPERKPPDQPGVRLRWLGAETPDQPGSLRGDEAVDQGTDLEGHRLVVAKVTRPQTAPASSDARSRGGRHDRPLGLVAHPPPMSSASSGHPAVTVSHPFAAIVSVLVTGWIRLASGGSAAGHWHDAASAARRDRPSTRRRARHPRRGWRRRAQQIGRVVMDGLTEPAKDRGARQRSRHDHLSAERSGIRKQHRILQAAGSRRTRDDRDHGTRTRSSSAQLWYPSCRDCAAASRRNPARTYRLAITVSREPSGVDASVNCAI
jgi:hypothetical protein